MPTIAAGMLPPPHFVAIVDDSAVKRSSIGLLPYVHRPDLTLKPRRFELSWQSPPAAVADAIQRHYDEHPLAVFKITLTATGEEVRVQFVARPLVQWSSAAFASSVTAGAEETLAYES